MSETNAQSHTLMQSIESGISAVSATKTNCNKRQCKQKIAHRSNMCCDDSPDMNTRTDDRGDTKDNIIWSQEWCSTEKSSVQCSFITQNEYDCMIMLCKTADVEIENLPTEWPNSDNSKFANTVILPCQHLFNPSALALHFLQADMRCPVCRQGPCSPLAIESIPVSLRSAFESKMKLRTEKARDEILESNILAILKCMEVQIVFLSRHARTQKSHMLHTRLLMSEQFENTRQLHNYAANNAISYSADELNVIANGLQMCGAAANAAANASANALPNTNYVARQRTHTVQSTHTHSFEDDLAQAIEEQLMSNYSNSRIDARGTVGTAQVADFQQGMRFNVHRSFNRVFAHLLENLSTDNGSKTCHVHIELTHPLIPVTIQSESFEIQSFKSFLLQKEGVVRIPLLCPSLGGHRPIAVFVLEHDKEQQTQQVYVDVDYMAVVHCAAYMHDILLGNLEVLH